MTTYFLGGVGWGRLGGRFAQHFEEVANVCTTYCTYRYVRANKGSNECCMLILPPSVPVWPGTYVVVYREDADKRSDGR